MKRMKLHYESKLRKTIIAPALVSFFCVSAAQTPAEFREAGLIHPVYPQQRV